MMASWLVITEKRNTENNEKYEKVQFSRDVCTAYVWCGMGR